MSIEDIQKKRGRPQINGESMVARFPPGTFEQIDGALQKPTETRTDFIRNAVAAELKKRARKAS